MQAQMFESRQVSRTMIRVEPDVQQKLAILGGEAADEVVDIPVFPALVPVLPIASSPRDAKHASVISRS